MRGEERSTITTIDADILVIGGGSAGCMAAIRALELDPGLRVVVFDKGDVRYSGSIPRGMDALNIVTVPGVGTAEQYVESAAIAADGTIDRAPSLVMAQRSWPLLKKLESWGVRFPPGQGEDYEVMQIHPKGRFAVSMQEPDLKTILVRRLTGLGALILDRTMAVRLLTCAGRVGGAVGMNVRTGQMIACTASAVILTAGGAARFGLPDSGSLYGLFDCPSNTGDAYVMAYRAGAELTGLEYTICFYLVRDFNAPLLCITLTRGAHLLNALGERVRTGNASAIEEMIAEHHRGVGPLRIRLSHLPADRIEAIEDILFTTERPAVERFFGGRGVDFRHRDIELGPTEFNLCGGHGLTGIRIDDSARSSVPGLYAAGDAASVGRGHLTGAFVFGELAAEDAVKRGRIGDLAVDADHTVSELEEMIASWRDNEGRVSIEEFEYKARRLINGYVVPPKNEFRLRRAIEELSRLRRELDRLARIRSVHDAVKAFEVDNIITCALLSATASLERKESRWGFWHYRSDYPDRSDLSEHIVVSRGGSDDEIIARPQPVRMTAAGGVDA